MHCARVPWAWNDVFYQKYGRGEHLTWGETLQRNLLEFISIARIVDDRIVIVAGAERSRVFSCV
jgi:hypothetical protein